MKFGPKTGDETTGLHYVYDAWNRMVAVYEDDGDGVYEPGTDDTQVASYEYDAANRRIEKTVAADGRHEHYFYNNQCADARRAVCGWRRHDAIERPVRLVAKIR